MRRKNNFFGITYQIIVALVQLGFLVPITSKNGIGVNGGHIEPINGYFRIKDTNFVWMHIQDGYGIIINEYVTTKAGKRLNLVSVLARYYWFIDNTSDTPRCHELQNRTLHRCIGSIILYGDINSKMPTWMEIHHKWWRWCNTENVISIVCRNAHQYFHNHRNTRKSHKKGVIISGIRAWKSWLIIIVVWDYIYKSVFM